MRFEYIRPQTLAEALKIIGDIPEARLLAGGTDILVELQERGACPPVLVDISRIEELNEISIEDGIITIGSMVTHALIAADSRLAHKASPLALGCAEVGSPQIRNKGTIGGNLVNASPAADAIPGLMALETSLLLAGPRESRELPLDEFLLGVKKNALKPGELLVSLSFPAMDGDEFGFFLKLGQRKALAISKVSAAGKIKFTGSQVASARIALGAVATTVIRAPRVEEYLIGKSLNPEIIQEAGKIAAGESRGISDIRSGADYRDEMAGLLVARGLENILHKSPSFSC